MLGPATTSCYAPATGVRLPLAATFKRALLIVSKQSARARICAKNLRRHSRISTLRTKVEILGLQVYQNLIVWERWDLPLSEEQTRHIVEKTKNRTFAWSQKKQVAGFTRRRSRVRVLLRSIIKHLRAPTSHQGPV